MGRLIGLIIFVLDLAAIIDCTKSTKTARHKALWIVVIIILPIFGLLAYYLIGKRH